VVKLLRRELELDETFRRRQLPYDLELLLPGERSQSRCKIISVVLRHESEEVRQVKHATRPVDLVHAVGNVRRNVDKTGELDFVTHSLEAFSDLESHNTTVTVTSDSVRPFRLGPLHCCCIAGNHLIHGGEEGVTRLEATSTESIEWTLVLEVFGKVDENKNLSDTRVNEEDGSLVSGQLKGNDGVVFLSLAVLGE